MHPTDPPDQAAADPVDEPLAETLSAPPAVAPSPEPRPLTGLARRLLTRRGLLQTGVAAAATAAGGVLAACAIPAPRVQPAPAAQHGGTHQPGRCQACHSATSTTLATCLSLMARRRRRYSMGKRPSASRRPRAWTR